MQYKNTSDDIRKENIVTIGWIGETCVQNSHNLNWMWEQQLHFSVMPAMCKSGIFDICSDLMGDKYYNKTLNMQKLNLRNIFIYVT
jgi:hypothetical protein